jgi:large subunit ribosomal protein L2
LQIIEQGRNNRGRITTRHKGGGHKRCYRLIDFKRNKYDSIGVVSIEYDPNRNANISLIQYEDGEKRYILHPETLKVGDTVSAGKIVKLKLECISFKRYSIRDRCSQCRIFPRKGGQLVRAELAPNLSERK